LKPYNRSLKPFSRRLRSNMTDAERMLWQRLRGKQVQGLQFYRQKPLLNYIVDFYCPKAGLVIELDGSQHLESEGRRKDAQRDRALAELGLRILRFDDRQVLAETEAVVEVIYRAVNPP
jgi:very-short-patch-repair endonuclease